MYVFTGIADADGGDVMILFVQYLISAPHLPTISSLWATSHHVPADPNYEPPVSNKIPTTAFTFYIIHAILT